jgi:hypothetical protein
MEPCRGLFELPAPRPMVFRVEYVRTKFVSKPSILYENGGPFALYVKGTVIITIYGIIPLPEVVAIETIVAQTYEGELGGETPLVVVVVEGV